LLQTLSRKKEDKMKKYLAIATFIILFLISCSEKSVIIKKDFYSNTYNPKSLSIIFPKQLPIFDVGNYAGFLCGSRCPSEMVYDFLKREMQHTIQLITHFDNVFNDSLCLDYKSNLEEIPLADGKTQSIRIPVNDTKLQTLNSTNRYILILDHIILYTKKPYKFPLNRQQVLRNMTSEGILTYSCTFVIWDNLNGEVCSYGSVEGSGEETPSLWGKTDPWTEACHELVINIFKKSKSKINTDSLVNRQLFSSLVRQGEIKRDFAKMMLSLYPDFSILYRNGLDRNEEIDSTYNIKIRIASDGTPVFCSIEPTSEKDKRFCDELRKLLLVKNYGIQLGMMTEEYTLSFVK
jgi:hypothetical protein